VKLELCSEIKSNQILLESTFAFMKRVRSLVYHPHHPRHLAHYFSNRQMATQTNTDNILHFHKWKIDPSQVFFTSTHCYGLINLKPIVPGTEMKFKQGHVCVSAVCDAILPCCQNKAAGASPMMRYCSQ
jgi:hypothetical protein